MILGTLLTTLMQALYESKSQWLKTWPQPTDEANGLKSSPKKTKCALITGITGQDGSLLAELLLEKGYCVVGTVRPSANYERIKHLLDRIELFPADLLDGSSVGKLLEASQPDEVYNLAASSFVPFSWSEPCYTADITAIGVSRLLEAVRTVTPSARFYQASSSEMFGRALPSPQSEASQFCPKTPYGVAKLYGHHMTVTYRESHGMYAVSGILYNHESPRRSPRFVSRKVTTAVARIKKGRDTELLLGNLDTRRDWGFAGDYVKAMWLMLQQDTPKDYVIATGVSHSVRQLCEIAFESVGLDYRNFVKSDPDAGRQVDFDTLVGDSSLAKQDLGWEPKLSFDQMIEMMVRSDLANEAEDRRSHPSHRKTLST